MNIEEEPQEKPIDIGFPNWVGVGAALLMLALVLSLVLYKLDQQETEHFEKYIKAPEKPKPVCIHKTVLKVFFNNLEKPDIITVPARYVKLWEGQLKYFNDPNDSYANYGVAAEYVRRFEIISTTSNCNP